MKWMATILLGGICTSACAQQPFSNSAGTTLPWNNRQAAVVLTYDDGLDVDLTNAIPALDSVGLKATFYIADFGGLRKQIPSWRAAAAAGHELANHTIYHPCAGGPGREFVQPDNDLRSYTVKQIASEIKTMNTLLYAMDGKTKRTFAFPCSDTRINDTPYINPVASEFVAARAVRNQMLQLNEADLMNLPSYMINGESGEQLIALVDEAMQKKALLIFLFHGVGGGHNLNVSLEAHSKLLHYLQAKQNQLWIAPMVDVASYIEQVQGKHN